ncbi:MAG TPA: sigma-54-dependent Fis family transcriptional regulator [Rectinemataceae bacterium]|nr:sigma-54-dependent Fis family transcriptional regulator [Rectinemataceae bacterium]
MSVDYIERGFERCRAYGIDPGQVHSSRILGEEELRDRLARKRELMVAAEPFIGHLYDFLRGSGFFSILTDDEGCILSLIGDEGILREASALMMVPGAFMDERSIGTNAMGTALAEGMPVQVSGDEHYIRAYHRWTCSGAPIRDAEGRIIGSLDLTGNSERVHQHTLGMVVAAVNAIEKTLILGSKNEALKSTKRFVETLIDSIQAGIVSVNLEGEILSVNSWALEMFGFGSEEMLGRRVGAFLQNWGEVRMACVSGGDFQNKDVLVDVRANKLYFNLTCYPIVGENAEPTGLILVFKDVKKVRKHANEILGRRALYTFDKILGGSRPIVEAIEFARKVADCRSTILITGESGTGKEIFAQAIQNASSRADEPFVVLNCGAIPRTLIESELFGYADGAFTGAKRGGQAGKFEIADGGTIFLDEIGEMPLDMQTRLLRVIEEGTVMRVGDSRDIPVDVRIIAATNKDLKAEVAVGNFRMDLFYRLNVLPLRLPPLRECREDIPLLFDFYMNKISKKLNKRPVQVSQEYMGQLMAYEWPGNVRELENMIELLISSERLPSLPGGRRSEPARAGIARGEPAAMTLEDSERRIIGEALEACLYNISGAAKRLGIGRNTLYRKMERYGITCPIPEHRPIMEQAPEKAVS